MKLAASVSVLAVVVAHHASAVPLIDGTADAEYGSALAVQGIQTGFGDANAGNTGSANGSELDQGFGVVSGSRLNLVLAGNLETNGNRLVVFLDTVAGGQNRLLANSGNGPIDRMGDDSSGNGLTFDTGFDADYAIMVNEFFGDVFVDLIDIAGNGAGNTFLGQFSVANSTTGFSNANAAAALNNSNTAGVGGGAGAASSGAGVTTGFEIAIELALIGSPTTSVDVSALIANNDGGFLSNQVLGSLPVGTDNLGEPRNDNFASLAGDQFFTVAVPEPASLALLTLGGLLIARRRG